MNKSKPPAKEANNNKNEQKNKESNNNNNNAYKKLIKKKISKKQKKNNTKIKINKDLIQKKINIDNEKKDLSSALLLNANQKNLSNIFKNLNREIISENITIETNPSLVSTLKECTYYKQECENLSSYIKQYYEKHKAYPSTDQNFYKYGRVLGKGAFGKVNLALHLASGRLVAIKSFNKKKLTTKRAKRKIKTEIEALSKLRNPFCTQIYDFFETDTHILIVMEYVCGDLLGFIKKRGKISESTAKIIFKQIIKGLQYIHKKKIVHRDIKLDNVLIDLTNTVKICDFGVCRILQPGDIMYEHCGTPAYIAPEIFKDEGYEGFSCDIWSAGVTLHYMLAGTQPFRANKIEDLKEIILKGEYERIEDVSNEANDLINGMLQLNPKKRLSIEDILRHPWLKNVDIKKRKNLNIFTNAEKGLLSKFDVNYLSSPKEELIEVFTVSNLITKEEKEEKGATKSDILAPYNSYAKKSDENDLYSDLKIENELCRFNFKAQLSNIKYELSNNQEFDNGIIKTIYNSVEGGNKKNNEEFENENTHTLNLSLDSIATFTGGLCDDIIKDIEEFIGYDKKYLVQCLRKNEINYATATYYLMLRDEMNSHY
jgi:serine/threonine protein kinase